MGLESQGDGGAGFGASARRSDARPIGTARAFGVAETAMIREIRAIRGPMPSLILIPFRFKWLALSR
jgi:hypothetical protein